MTHSKQIIEVAEGAYFVPSYSEQTVLLCQPGWWTQSVIMTTDEGDENDMEVIEEEKVVNALDVL